MLTRICKSHLLEFLVPCNVGLVGVACQWGEGGGIGFEEHKVDFGGGSGFLALCERADVQWLTG